MNEVEIVTREVLVGLEYSEDAKIFSISKVMNRAYAAVLDELKTQECDKKEEGVVYARYREVDFKAMHAMGFLQKMFGMFDTFKMDMGISVDGFVYDNSTLKRGEIPAGQYVQYLHKGAYSKIYKAYDKLAAYIVDNDIDVVNESYDIYLNDPYAVKEDELETIVMIKIV